MIVKVSENVYYYEIPGIRSVTIAFIVGSGPVYEPDHLLGISHFIEHIAFRKTKKRSMKQIKLPIEQIGGILNAWTDKENTVYYAKVPSTFFRTAFNILKELVFEPDFTEKNLELEKKIILEEYYSEQEVPEQRLYNKFFETLIDGPHSKSVIGTEKTIKNITLKDLQEFHSEMYSPYNVKIFVAGNVSKGDFKLLKSVELHDGIKTAKHVSRLRKGITFDKFEETQQFHILLSHESTGLADDELLYPALVLNTILGSGMSSLLFEKIRERKGLVYDIATQNIQSREWGVFTIYAAASEKNAEKVIKEIFNIFRNFQLTKKLFNYGKKRLLGMLELATESTSTLTSLYIQYVANDVEVRTIEEFVNNIKQVTENDVMRVFEKLIAGQWSLAYVTPGTELGVTLNDLVV